MTICSGQRVDYNGVWLILQEDASKLKRMPPDSGTSYGENTGGRLLAEAASCQSGDGGSRTRVQKVRLPICYKLVRPIDSRWGSPRPTELIPSQLMLGFPLKPLL